MGQRLPDLLGDEGHEGVQQLEGAPQDVHEHPLRREGGLPARLQAGFAEFDIPVAEHVPDEVVELLDVYKRQP